VPRRQGRIIAVTAHGNDGPTQSVSIMKKGVADYIPKPFAETGQTLEKAIREMLENPDGGAPRDSALSAVDVEQTTPLKPFGGGAMVFYTNRVELCEVVICSGTSGNTRRALLDLMRLKNGDRYEHYSCSQLGTRLKLASAAGLIRSTRNAIAAALRDGAGVDCKPGDVILSGGSGYRLSNKVIVQDAGLPVPNADQGHPRKKRRIDPKGHVPNVPNPHVPNVPGQANVRRTWILEQLRNEVELLAPAIVDRFQCNIRTAKRDLKTLKDDGLVEFVGTTCNGYYRLCDPVNAPT